MYKFWHSGIQNKNNYCILFPGSVRKTAPAFQQQHKEIFFKSSLRGSFKRGRPIKPMPRDSFDSCNGSDASSCGSLDSFIPLPKNFRGRNNPFRDVDNCLRIIPDKSEDIRTFDEVISVKQPPLWKRESNSDLNSMFCSKLRKRSRSERPLCVTTTCARRLTLDGEIQYLVERECPLGLLSPKQE